MVKLLPRKLESEAGANELDARPVEIKLSAKEQRVIERAMGRVAVGNLKNKLRNTGHQAVAGVAILGVTVGVMTSFKKDLKREQLIMSDAKALIAPTPQIAEHNATPGQALHDLTDVYSMGGGLYRDENNPLSGVASAWHLYGAANAEQLDAMLPGLVQTEAKSLQQQIVQTVQEYYEDDQPSDFAGGIDPNIHILPFEEAGRYVDDNLWWGIYFATEANRSGNERYLQIAKQSFDLAVSQWDDSSGGIFWKEQLPGEDNHARALVSNVPAIVLAGEIMQAEEKIKHQLSETDKKYYISWSEKIFDWSKTHLENPKTGLFIDHIGPEGKPDNSIYTYGEGMVAGAMNTLNGMNPQKYPLQSAVNFANKVMDYCQKNNIYGTARYDAIYLRQLMRLAAKYNHPDFTQKVIHTQKLIKAAMPNHPTDLKGAASDTAIVAENALPQSEWPLL